MSAKTVDLDSFYPNVSVWEFGKVFNREDFYTPAEFARECNVSAGTVNVWIRRGKLMHAIRVDISDLCTARIQYRWLIPHGTPKPEKRKPGRRCKYDITG